MFPKKKQVNRRLTKAIKMLDSNENPQYHVKFAYVMGDEIREKEIIVNAQSIGKAKINAHNKMRELGYKGFTMKDISSV